MPPRTEHINRWLLVVIYSLMTGWMGWLTVQVETLRDERVTIARELEGIATDLKWISRALGVEKEP